MESAVETREPAEQLFESELSTTKETEGTETFHDNGISEQRESHSCGDMIFEGDEPEERGDHVVGSDFECGAVDVIWLANNELDEAAIDKESDFYPSVEVGANETATVVDSKRCHADNTASATPSAPATPDFSRLESPASPPAVDGQCQSKPLHNEPAHVHEPAHEAASDLNIFSDAVSKPNDCGKSPWAPPHGKLAPVSCAESVTVNPLLQEKTFCTVNHLPSNNFVDCGHASMVGGAKNELRPPNIPGYVLHPNSFQLPTHMAQRNGIIPPNPNHVFQQQQQQQQQNDYGCPGNSVSYLTYPMVPTTRNTLPPYNSDGFPSNQQFIANHPNSDVNSNVLPYQIGQGRPEDYGCQMNYVAPSNPIRTFEATRDFMPLSLRQDVVPLQQPVRATPWSIEQSLGYPSVKQLSNNTAQTIPLCRAPLISSKTTVTGATLLAQDVTFANGSSGRLNPSGFQMPVASTHPQQAERENPLESQNACVDSSEQRDCCPPVLTPSAGPAQENDNEAAVVSTPVTSQMPSSFVRTASSSANTSSSVTKLEDVVAFKAPRRLGINLMKYARCPKKRSQTIDVLMKNSVKNLELSTAVASTTPLFLPASPVNVGDDDASREDRSRIRSQFPIVRYPSMVDVNFRRRPGVKAPSRPRHLCDQTREVIGRVCAYFREFSKRFASLGNNIAGTPFENPERMAAHATGFTLPTIRRCCERMEVIPHCTYRPGSLPTEDELSKLSSTFAGEPWLNSLRARNRCGAVRKRTKKPSTPSSVSLSEMEKDPEESADEPLSEGDVEPYQPEEKGEGAPKLRRSQRILNQRRAKMMTRQRIKKLEGKTVNITHKKDGGKANIVTDEAGGKLSTACSNQDNKQTGSTVDNQTPAYARPEVRKKRNRRTSSPIPSTDSKSDHDRRAVHVVKRSRSASRLMDNDNQEVPLVNFSRNNDDGAIVKPAEWPNRTIDNPPASVADNDRTR
ncbi:hypothetical protein GCK32_000686 [Trichostrongylus colubriformis]|uniref:Uncharacterized protein n=1 Tax=Trichostrongylus colubriformis TaxID=6319 RepID=A0AAN8ISL7_TRICO